MKKIVLFMFMMVITIVSVSQAIEAIYVENYSFEQPGDGKIKGWDQADGAYYPNNGNAPAEVPGWESVGTVVDSGVEQVNATDGSWSAFMMTTDPAFYQVTGHTVSVGDSYRVTVSAKDLWNAGDIDIALYYTFDGGSTLNELITQNVTITTNAVDYSVEYTVENETVSGSNLVILFDDTTGGNGWTVFDNVRLDLLVAGRSLPSHPGAIPLNAEDGSVGTVNPDLTVTDVDLTFVAAADPNYPVQGGAVLSGTDSYNIYLQTNPPADANLVLVGVLPEAGQSPTDPNRIFPLSSYTGENGPGILKQGTKYMWRVEQVLTNPLTSSPYPAGDPNNVFGGFWFFTTASAIPQILTNPHHTLTDLNGDATLTITATKTADNFRWFKVGDPDVELSDGGFYSGTQTNTLTITGMAADGSDDAQYYAIVYNGVPGDVQTQASTPSAVAWVWYPREVHRYTFESTYPVDSNSFVADTIGTSNIQMMSADGGPDLASIEPNNPNAPGLVGTQSLYLNNPIANPADPNNVDGQYAQINDPLVGAYADITIAAWVYHKGGGWQRILSLGNTNDGWGPIDDAYLYLCPSADNVSGRLRLNIHGQQVTAPDGSVPVNEWAYVTATLSGNTAKLYVNGEWVATNSNFTTDPIGNGPTVNNWIGRSQWYRNDSLFNGYIADLRIWNYGLSNDQVAQAYMDDDTNAGYVCNSEINDLPYDYNGNCIIDLGDLAIFAGTWLDSYRILPE